jgi:hypothetical protein
MAVPTINNPCPEQWNEMSKRDQGRFCGKCAKLVFDFTKKTTQEIIDFLSARKGEEICGKLPVRKLQPIAIRVSKRTRLFSAAMFVVFGSLLFTACGSDQQKEEPMGKIGVDSATQAQQQRNYDSVMRADSLQKTAAPATNQSTNIDSIKMMQMMHVLDSVNTAKKK